MYPPPYCMGQPLVECSRVQQAAHVAYPIPFGEHIVQYPVGHGRPISRYHVPYVELHIYPLPYYTGHPIDESSCVQGAAQLEYSIPFGVG